MFRHLHQEHGSISLFIQILICLYRKSGGFEENISLIFFLLKLFLELEDIYF